MVADIERFPFSKSLDPPLSEYEQINKKCSYEGFIRSIFILLSFTGVIVLLVYLFISIKCFFCGAAVLVLK